MHHSIASLIRRSDVHVNDLRARTCISSGSALERSWPQHFFLSKEGLPEVH